MISRRESREIGLDFFFVDRTPLRDWVRCPFRDSTEEGKYLAALTRVRPGHEEKLPAWMATIQVDFTGNLEAVWR